MEMTRAILAIHQLLCVAALLFALAAATGTPVSADPADPVNPLKKRFLTGKALDDLRTWGLFSGSVPKNPGIGQFAPAGLIGIRFHTSRS